MREVEFEKKKKNSRQVDCKPNLATVLRRNDCNLDVKLSQTEHSPCHENTKRTQTQRDGYPEHCWNDKQGHHIIESEFDSVPS